jgi:hypothetical protein
MEQLVTLQQITTRIRRLDALARGLAKEVLLWQRCNDPLLYRERKAYPDNIHKATAGLEAGRVALVKARQRLEQLSGRADEG